MSPRFIYCLVVDKSSTDGEKPSATAADHDWLAPPEAADSRDSRLANRRAHRFVLQRVGPMKTSNVSSRPVTRARQARRRRTLVPGLLCAALLVAACASSPSSSGGAAVKGGTVTLAVVGVPPNYVFPFLTPQADSGSNFTYMLATRYVPLYTVASTIVPSQSEADPPTYSNGNKTVTLQLKSYRWSNGTPVTSRDVIFAFNLLKANKTSWANYVPGELPDNVTSISAPSQSTVVFQLSHSVNSTCFTDD